MDIPIEHFADYTLFTETLPQGEVRESFCATEGPKVHGVAICTDRRLNCASLVLTDIEQKPLGVLNADTTLLIRMLSEITSRLASIASLQVEENARVLQALNFSIGLIEQNARYNQDDD